MAKSLQELNSFLAMFGFVSLNSKPFQRFQAATQLQGHAMRLMGRHHDRSEDLLCSLFDKEVTGGGILKGVEGVPAHFFPICMGKC